MIRYSILLLSFVAVLTSCSEQSADYQITSFGAKADGTTVNTKAIQGSKDTADYWVNGNKHGMILAFESTGVSISGEGEINGNRSSFRLPDRSHMGADFVRKSTRQGEQYLLPDPLPQDGPWSYDTRLGMMTVSMQCEDASIRDVSIRDSPQWTVRIADCDDVRINGISNLVIYDSNRGIGVFSREQGSIDNILFSDITIKNHLYTGHWRGNGEPIHVSAINRQTPM